MVQYFYSLQRLNLLFYFPTNMKRFLSVTIIALALISAYLARASLLNAWFPSSGAPPYDTAFDESVNLDRFAWIYDWKRPEGPAKVALQAGHWKNDELPEELSGLRGSTGATGGGKAEWEVNLAIAQKAKEILEARGVVVDILPATVPVRYWADAFVAIHADGNTDTRVSGFKLAHPRRDMSGKAPELLTFIEKSYGAATNLEKDPNVSRNMRGYYAFAWWRRDHAVHPKAASVIIETGFLTSPRDRRVIVGTPEISAQGIAGGILGFLEHEQLL